jgi:hypothetical protein
MILAKQEVLDAIRRAGLYSFIEGREHHLPDLIDVDRDASLLAGFGINEGMLVELMGGSP